MQQTIISAAQKTLQLEAESIGNLVNYIDDSFVQVVQLIHQCKGRVIISGIGKSAIVGQKIVSTLNSTGTAALYMHAADAIHGDLGMVQQDDVVIIISKSGESPEIKVLVSLIKNFGNKLIALTGNINSFLAKQAHHILNATILQEACPNNLAPTTSTTAQMAMGDALAVALMEINGFNSTDFARYHPGGNLGKKLYLRVEDLYNSNEAPKVSITSNLKEVIVEITSKRLGATAVINNNSELLGIITDGDLRRMLEKNVSIENITAQDILTINPKTISPETLAVEALGVMQAKDISQLVVTNGSTYLGILHIHDLIREGIV